MYVRFSHFRLILVLPKILSRLLRGLRSVSRRRSSVCRTLTERQGLGLVGFMHVNDGWGLEMGVGGIEMGVWGCGLIEFGGESGGECDGKMSFWGDLCCLVFRIWKDVVEFV